MRWIMNETERGSKKKKLKGLRLRAAEEKYVICRCLMATERSWGRNHIVIIYIHCWICFEREKEKSLKHKKKNYYKILKYVSIRYKTFFMYCLAFLTCATIRLPAYANKFIEEIMYHAYYEHKPTSRICNV